MTTLIKAKTYAVTFMKWSILGVILGVLGGALGAGFHHALHFVTHTRLTHTWLVYLLPVGGLLSVALYHILKLNENRGTNEIIEAVLHSKPVSPLIAPAIFVVTAITHFFGGSAGREGAALQLGGSVASLLGHFVKPNEKEKTVLVMGGMSAVFAGLFGTPLTACLFVMEFISVGTIFSPALLPCFLAAYTASRVSTFLGVHAETYLLPDLIQITYGNVWKVLLLAVLLALLGIAMCKTFHAAEHFAKKAVKNTYLRIAIGGMLIVCMTLLVGDHRYNGAGMDLALLAVSGKADWYDFILKMLFTAVTLAAGFKGGEIVPTFCIGATFGCLIGSILGFDPSLSAALGLVGLFCCVTNSPIASMILSIEMFGSSNICAFALVCVIGFVLSGHSSLYASQIIQFPKHQIEGQENTYESSNAN